MLSGHRGLLRVVVHLESGFVPLHTPVTRESFFRRRCARRSVLHKTIGSLRPTPFAIAAFHFERSRNSPSTNRASRRGEADGPPGRQPKPLVSHADPSAT